MISEAVRHMLAAGMAPEAVVAAIDAMEQSSSVISARTARQDRNARYYARKASEKRLNKTHQDVSDESPETKVSPTPPLKTQPLPSTPTVFRDTTRAREADEFEDDFWPAYPNRVGKAHARKAFQRARRKVPLADLLTGIERYVLTKPPDREWCNPATWLNQERWTDQPAPIACKSNGPRNDRPDRRTFADAQRDYAARAEEWERREMDAAPRLLA